MLRILANNRIKGSLANHFRRRRFEAFRLLIAGLPRPVKILDVGGEENFWKQMGIRAEDGLRITLLNLNAEAVSLPFIDSLAGDGRNMSQFADASFDVVFSNSVLEHVGDFRDQVRMAKEVARVGKRFYLQTPAKTFPLEPHFLFPFFALLPLSVRCFLVRHFNLGWYRRIPSKEEALEFLRGFQLLRESEVRSMFPEAALIKERFLGFTKSFICYKGFD